jgi:hypothetical protein
MSVAEPPQMAFQSDGLSVYETEGHWFESSRAHLRNPPGKRICVYEESLTLEKGPWGTPWGTSG